MDWTQPKLERLRQDRRKRLHYAQGREDHSFTLRLSTDLASELSDYAEWLGASRNAVITMILGDYLTTEECLADEFPDPTPMPSGYEPIPG